jgi:hypothetical protein
LAPETAASMPPNGGVQPILPGKRPEGAYAACPPGGGQDHSPAKNRAPAREPAAPPVRTAGLTAPFVTFHTVAARLPALTLPLARCCYGVKLHVPPQV